MKTKKIHFKSCYIAGFTYYDGASVFNNLKIGSKIKLKLEPSNTYDDNAIVLKYKKFKLGYVPKECNKELAQILKAKYKIFTAIVQQLSESEHPDRQVKVSIFIDVKSH